MKTKEIEKELMRRSPLEKPIADSDWLSSGITLLNLAVSGRPDGIVAKGNYIWIVGDSSTGKTWQSMGMLAEAARNVQFDKHRFIYDDVEHGALFEPIRYFGRKVAERLEPPSGTKAKPVYSGNVQEFYFNLDTAIRTGKPFIYVCDSMDALEAAEDEEKFLAQKEAYGTDKYEKLTGSFGMAKAKANSQNIKRYVSRMHQNGSILIVISQTRDNIKANPYAHGPAKKASGGHALKFFAGVQLWTSLKGELSRTVMKKDREYGKQIIFDVQKNRMSGWEGKIEVPFLRKFGFDDTGASIDWLCVEGFWNNNKGIIHSPQFGFKGRREDLIKKIEESEDRLTRLVGYVTAHWRKIDDAVTLKRRKRYE